jgi:hypothetical protein
MGHKEVPATNFRREQKANATRRCQQRAASRSWRAALVKPGRLARKIPVSSCQPSCQTGGQFAETLMKSSWEHSVRDRGVGGSNPLAPTNFTPKRNSKTVSGPCRRGPFCVRLAVSGRRDLCRYARRVAAAWRFHATRSGGNSARPGQLPKDLARGTRALRRRLVNPSAAAWEALGTTLGRSRPR